MCCCCCKCVNERRCRIILAIVSACVLVSYPSLIGIPLQPWDWCLHENNYICSNAIYIYNLIVSDNLLIDNGYCDSSTGLQSEQLSFVHKRWGRSKESGRCSFLHYDYIRLHCPGCVSPRWVDSLVQQVALSWMCKYPLSVILIETRT
jgi:hypothetical protein